MTYRQQPYPGQGGDPATGGTPAYPGGGGNPAYPGSGGFPAGQAGPGYPGGQGGYPGGQGGPGYPGGGMPAYPAGNDPQAKPSGGTAITAGVLALLGAAWAIYITLANFSLLSGLSGGLAHNVALGQGLAYAVEVVTLGVGGVLLFLHKSAGRWLVVVGCAVDIVQAVVVVIALASSGALADIQGVQAGGGAFGVLLALSPAIVTLVLALVPATGRWCARRAAQPAVAVPAYPQQPQQW